MMIFAVYMRTIGYVTILTVFVLAGGWRHFLLSANECNL